MPQDLLRMQRGLPPAAFEEGFDGSAWVAAVREADSTVVLRRLLGEVGGMGEAGWVWAHMMPGRETKTRKGDMQDTCCAAPCRPFSTTHDHQLVAVDARRLCPLVQVASHSLTAANPAVPLSSSAGGVGDG